jgi:VCBS repeat-containing protein
MLRSKVTLLFMTLGLLLAEPAVVLAQDAGDPTGAPSPAPPAPTIQSDKADYAPSELVTLTGSNWQPGESVNINVIDDVGQTWKRNVDVIADENGNITDQFNLPDHFVATYYVTATGADSGAVAKTTFTDGNLQAEGNVTGSEKWMLTWTRYSGTTTCAVPSGGSILEGPKEEILGQGNRSSNIENAGSLFSDATDSAKLIASPGLVDNTGNKEFDRWTDHDGNFVSNNQEICVVGFFASSRTYTAHYITPDGVNDAPENLVPGGQSTNEDTQRVFNTSNRNLISVSDRDAGSNPVGVSLRVTNGTLTLSGTSGLTFSPVSTNNDGTNDTSMFFTGTLSSINNALNGLRYDPTADFNSAPPNGPAQLTISTNDLGNTLGISGTGPFRIDTDVLQITVTPGNQAPVAVDDEGTTDEDEHLTVEAPGVLGNDTDADDGDDLTAEVVAGPSSGQLTLDPDGSYTYTPNANFNGPDTFTYRANDGTANSNTATVTINVAPVDDPPAAVNDQVAVQEDDPATPINVLGNDTDSDGGPKTIASVTQPSNGSVVLTGDSPGAHTGLTYKPNANYCNDPPATNLDTFTYTLNGGSQNAQGTVSMKVTCLNDAPTQPGTISSDEVLNNDGAFTLDWGASTDVDGNDLTYTLEKMDSDDSNWTNVESGLTSTSYTFGDTNPDEGEGTWDYRVKAVDSPAGAQSDYSTAENLVKVDKSGPNDPTLSFNTSANQSLKATVSGVDWYKDSALIDVAANGDKTLADTSDGSGVDAASLLPNPFSVSTNGMSTASRKVKDNATNESDAGTLQVNVDAADPTFSNCPTAGPFILNSGSGTQSVGPITASDGESGVDNAASTLSGSVNTSTVGGKSVTFKAVDHVGHEATKECTYNVNYTFSGFLQPIKHQTGTEDVSTFKAGSTVPVKIQLKDANGNVVQSASAPQWLTPQMGSATSQAVDESVYSDTPTTGGTFRWDTTGQQYIYNWGTAKNQTGSYWRVGVKLDDGQTYYVNISLG